MTLADEEATARLGACIGRGLGVGDAVLLEGELGAGKTVLARAILRSLGVTEYVPSPSFTLVQAYETRGPSIRHFDLYRIEREAEIEELGLDEALGEGAVLIEWPDRARARMPGNALSVRLETAGPTARRARIAGPARWRAAFEGIGVS